MRFPSSPKTPVSVRAMHLPEYRVRRRTCYPDLSQPCSPLQSNTLPTAKVFLKAKQMFASVSLWWDPKFACCYCLTDIGLELGSPDTVLSYRMLGNGHQQVFQTKRLFFKRSDSSFGLLIDWWTCLHVPAGAWPFSAQTVLEKGAQLPWNLNSSVLFIVFNYKTCRFWRKKTLRFKVLRKQLQ